MLADVGLANVYVRGVPPAPRAKVTVPWRTINWSLVRLLLNPTACAVLSGNTATSATPGTTLPDQFVPVLNEPPAGLSQDRTAASAAGANHASPAIPAANVANRTRL